MLITKIKWFILDFINIRYNNLKFRVQPISSQSISRYPNYNFKREKKYFIRETNELSRGNS
ncbi:MAG: hypothetical protein CO128_07025 [Ignavibacteriales bacterium CG_4_9_14_3_um_filter_30_11]|nr:MAG: hypothetical protein CO128_07025 [Ignavibacteriales bacterium CG_4_9_14_3_um_filter_30_11]